MGSTLGCYYLRFEGFERIEDSRLTNEIRSRLNSTFSAKYQIYLTKVNETILIRNKEHSQNWIMELECAIILLLHYI